MRLNTATLDNLPPSIARPGYERQGQASGIVHFGIGAFHRAHQAVYTDAALGRGERDWLITGVSLRSANVADQLNPQDGLYLANMRSAAGDAFRVIGSVAKVLVAGGSPEAVVAAIAAPSTHIVSFTVTEKGYCRAADGSLDHNLADGASIYRFLHAGLAQRRAEGLPGVTLLSCDNLSDNGRQLERLVGEYLLRQDAALAHWVGENCTFPCSMVDRIVPATTTGDVDAAEELLGLRDTGLVLTEPFTQWVIEDRFAGPRPQWEKSGVQFVADVAPWEKAKLRMLNGAHSALAYIGLMRGYDYVHQAIADQQIREMIQQLMLAEAAPTLPKMPGFSALDYATDLMVRFDNPALNHRLEQIAMDGSQKIPQRWLETLRERHELGRQSPVIMAAIAAWIHHLSGRYGSVSDPIAEQFNLAVSTEALAEKLFGAHAPMELPSEIFGTLSSSMAVRRD
ncbi:MAG: mannitol dehydrogenase family protein [Alphaproteobacteria bacterium]|nr:mannitol dehydrogenase family protein [Alphaproteobacteria bacterium]